MDLEQYKQFVEMQKSLGGGGGGQQTLYIVLAVLGAFSSVITAVASWIAKQGVQESREKIKEITDSQEVATEETKKIHIAVNNRDTASVQEIKNLNLKNEEMVKILATLQEKMNALINERDQTSRTQAAVSASQPKGNV